MPIDILIGSDKPKLALEEGCSFKEFCGIVDSGKDLFIEMRKRYQLYDRRF